ncbi:MAG: type II toxin-antitoxin system HicB family antitoxin [Oscillospiraceae bacterium]|nr:type II toxin-antitoxin system HicB family antitoxin [Oscillospiraceae bacterium]
MKLIYPVIIIPTGENDYFVRIPDMDIATQGNSIENAIDMARDAICLTAVDMQEDGKPLPAASDISAVTSEEKRAIITLVDADVTAYKRMLDKRAVRKNVTIPSWLNEAAEAQHINFSAVLQSALMEQLNINL